MLAMMDTMGDLAHQFKKGDNWNYGSGSLPYDSWQGFNSYPPRALSGYPGGYYPGTIPGPPAYPYGATPYYSTKTPSEVDGIWIGQGGEIVLVMYGYFRIYADAEIYRDGRYRIDGQRLLMHDPESGITLEYQYALDSGRMIMRGENGTLLLFKQLPIPIPPYMLLPKTDSTYQQFDPDQN